MKSFLQTGLPHRRRSGGKHPEFRRRLGFEWLEQRQLLSASPTPVGAEFQVNTFTTGAQSGQSGSIATDAAGDFVVVWQSAGQDGNGYGIYAQRYNASGAVQGSEFRVNTYTTGNQILPAVGMDAAGDFVVTWNSSGEDGSGYGVYAQRYNSTGTAQGSEFRVNTYTTGSQGTVHVGPRLAMDSAGDFVIAWESATEDGGNYGIYAQRYNSSGAAAGSEFRVNTYTTGNQKIPDAAMDSAGDLVIAWESATEDGSNYGIYAQRYNSAGTAQGSEFRVNSYTTGSQLLPAVAMDPVGDFVVAWTSEGEDGDNYGIYAQRYNSAGAAQGLEFRANSYASGNQTFASVSADSAGDFVITWTSYGEDGSGYGVYAQRYNLVGAPQGSEFRVNTFTNADQLGAAVAVDSGGDFVIAWSSDGEDGSDFGVFAQRYDATITTALTGSNHETLSIGFSSATQFTITINGTTTSYNTSTTPEIIFNGVAADTETVVIADSFNAYQANFSLGSVQMSSSNFEFDAVNTAMLYVYAGSSSQATMTLPSVSAYFVGVADPDYSYLSNAVNIYTEASGFGSTTAVGAGGSTYAYFYSASNATATVNPTGTSTLAASGLSVAASNFPQLYVVGASDGTDTVTLDSIGHRFVAGPLFSYVTDSTPSSATFTFLAGALYCAHVTADASNSGTDTAFFDSYSGNAFVGSTANSTLSGSNTLFSSFTVQAVGYDSVVDFASGSGTDTASLTSTGGGTLVGTTTYTTLTVGSVSLEVAEYAAVTATGTSTDTAYLYDGPGNNTLTASGNNAQLATTTNNYSVTDFGSVLAEQTSGSDDVKDIASIDFSLQTVGTWITG